MLRRVLSTVLLLLVAALLGGAGGFAYAHDPQRDVLTIAVESASPAGAAAAPLSGTVVEAGDGRLHLDSARGPMDLALPVSARIEELRTLPVAGLTPGTPVNVGVERSDSGMAISGIVAVEVAR
jgi:hypothetical protein